MRCLPAVSIGGLPIQSNRTMIFLLLFRDAQLFAPDLAGDFFHRAFGEMTQVKGPKTDADQARDFQSQMLHQTFDLAVLAFLEADHGPGIRTLGALELSCDWAVSHAVES